MSFRKLFATLGCFCLLLAGQAQTPQGWAVNPNQYQYTATLTGQLTQAGVPLTDTGLVLLAWVGGDLRGVAEPVDVGGQALFFLTIYSNQTTGELLHFQAYRAVEDSLYDVLDSLVFTSNQQWGDPASPFELRLSGESPPQFKPLPMVEIGLDTLPVWVDLGTYVHPPDASARLKVLGHSATLHTQVDGYQLTLRPRSQQPRTDTVWLGLLDPQDSTQVFDEAFLYLQARAINQPIDWQEIPLRYLSRRASPCLDLRGYLRHAAGKALAWEALPGPAAPRGKDSVAWQVNPASFSTSMTLTAHCQVEGFGLAHDGYQLAAFDQAGNLRGVAQAQSIAGRRIHFLTIYGDQAGDTLTLQLWDAQGRHLYQERTQTLVFAPNRVVGQAGQPQPLFFGGYHFTFEQGQFCLQRFDSGALAIDSLRLVAQETNTAEGYADTTYFSLRYLPEHAPELTAVPGQSWELGYPMQPINLTDYLIERDGDSVAFAARAQQFRVAIDAGQRLTLQALDTLWTGEDTVWVKVNDVHAPGLQDSVPVVFGKRLNPPIALFDLPDQTILPNSAFRPVLLRDLLDYERPEEVRWEIRSTQGRISWNGGELDMVFPPGWEGSDTVFLKAIQVHDHRNFAADTAIYTVSSTARLGDPMSQAIQVYPNPTEGTFTMQGHQLRHLEVLTMQGQVIHQTTLQDSQQPIELSLPAGVYLLRVEQQEGSSLHWLWVHR